jgi:hypothetical protein
VDAISNNAIYEVTLTALPRIAGVITHATFRYTAMVDHVVTEIKTFSDSQTVKLYNTAKANHFYPDTGCQFDTSTPPTISTNPGPSYTSVDFTSDVLSFAVYYNGKDWRTFSSSLKVAQKKTVTKAELKDRVDTINMELPWGEQKGLPGRPGETLLSFTFQTFKGGTITFTAPNFGYSNFLQVNAAADGGAQVLADIDRFA